MLLILAHDHDEPARALAERWGDAALLLTVGDLHQARWSLEIDRDGRVRAALALGTPVPVTGVVNRLGVFTDADLARVHREDRAYAAAELTAFALAWLDACPAPVLNPPNPRCLNGPAWYPEEWAAAAASVGLRVSPPRRRVELGPAPVAVVPEWPDARPANVVDGRCLGDVHRVVGERLCELARQAGTPLLTATVSGAGADAEVREISAWPDLADPEVADAVLAALGGCPRGASGLAAAGGASGFAGAAAGAVGFEGAATASAPEVAGAVLGGSSAGAPASAGPAAAEGPLPPAVSDPGPEAAAGGGRLGFGGAAGSPGLQVVAG
ncbi:hypothetical protein M8542_19745 [Amycolatopsis sp. OK19-0408]|uniref:Uncharacterized protein n=1 Tax=Amycolatopsis iheyensis TaxID=2945988 RepID=A0A9X2SLX7_9PSEU|nr:hypothetical protein [Amycolatopsis iheyensis]MCR6485065.1 hypothetical protein [Amycolatopsis iheyensis]